LLAHALQEEHDCQLVVLSEEPRCARHVDFIAEHRIRTTFLPANPLKKIVRLRALLVRGRIESLFCFLPSDTLVGALVGRSGGVKRIYGGLRNARLLRRKAWALRLVHNHLTDLTISNSHEAAAHFSRRGFARDKLLVIPNGIFVGEPLPARPETAVVTILTVGRFVEEKDYRTALEALRHVIDDGIAPASVRYVVAGYGPLEAQIRQWTRELGLEDSVELVIDPDDLDPLFARADIYFSTSRYEGLSNAIMEAMNACLPVVATHVGDNARLVSAAVNGYLAPAGDARNLADHLLALVRSSELRNRLGAASHALLERLYSFEAFKGAYARVLGG
jgi:glycosyltransferase involved in cell wall biosynthesis